MRARVAIIALLLLIGIPVAVTLRGTSVARTERSVAPPRATPPSQDGRDSSERSPEPRYANNENAADTTADAAPTSAPNRIMGGVFGGVRSANGETPVENAIRWASDVQDERLQWRDRAVHNAYSKRDPRMLRRLAQEFAADGEPMRAADALRRATQINPDDAELRFEFAGSLMHVGLWADAVDQLRRVVHDDRFALRAWHNLGVALMTLGRLHEAREAWDEVLRRDPQSVEAFVRRGEALLDLREWSAAAADFAEALRLAPECEECRMNRSLALYRMGELESAEEELRAALSLNPRNVEALNRLARIGWELFSLDAEAYSGQLAIVIDACQRSLEAKTNQPDVRALLEMARTSPGVESD